VDSCQRVQIRSAIADRAKVDRAEDLEVACLVPLIPPTLSERRLSAASEPGLRLVARERRLCTPVVEQGCVAEQATRNELLVRERLRHHLLLVKSRHGTSF
jgi:hypothetical protein